MYIAEKFIELNEDDETKDFIEKSQQKSEFFLTQLMHSLVMSVFQWFMSVTSVNG